MKKNSIQNEPGNQKFDKCNKVLSGNPILFKKSCMSGLWKIHGKIKSINYGLIRKGRIFNQKCQFSIRS